MDEPEFLALIPNHAELRRKLSRLSMGSNLGTLDLSVLRVTRAWYTLAKQHLSDARFALKGGRQRSIYSRAYYAAYNASKAIRYYVYGAVSLKGDDHRKIADLPDDFPRVAVWTRDLAELYQHRLRADYDNWSTSAGQQTLSGSICVKMADKFLKDCRKYVKSKYGVDL